MNESNPPPSQEEAPLAIPPRTTPTWEVELLISGALVFSLFSLRDPLESALLRWLPTTSDSLRSLVIFGYLYGKMVLYTLLLTFSLHLAARARWVALVGVHSVYPHGPRWEHFNSGPVAKKIALRQYAGGVEAAIERADNQASLVFAFGLLAAQMLLGIALVSAFIGLLGGLLPAMGVADRRVPALLAALFVLPVLFATSADKWLVHRLPEDHWVARLCERLYGVLNVLILARATQPLMMLLTTNLGGKRGPLLLVGAIYLMITVVGLDSMHRVSGRQLFPSELPNLQRDGDVVPSHYATLRRGDLRYATSPFIQSEIVEGPYLKLVVPYVPQRHDRALSSRCAMQDKPAPALDADTRHALSRAAEQQRIDCFGALLGLRIDGKTPAAVDFERYRDPAGNGEAVLAMIDIRALPAGRHTLSVAREPQADDVAPADDDDDPVIDYQIVFWR